MLPFQLDSPLCMGYAGSKFREGRGHSYLTHPFVGHAGVKFREGSGHAKLTHPLVSHPRVKFREGCCPSKLTHPFVGNAGSNLEKDVALPSCLTL